MTHNLSILRRPYGTGQCGSEIDARPIDAPHQLDTFYSGTTLTTEVPRAFLEPQKRTRPDSRNYHDEKIVRGTD